MAKAMEFKQISAKERDTMVANFVETIGNLRALRSTDLSETMDACELIGARLRDCFISNDVDNKGLLLFARLIIERANQSNA